MKNISLIITYFHFNVDAVYTKCKMWPFEPSVNINKHVQVQIVIKLDVT